MSERLEEIRERFNAMTELESFRRLAPTDLFFDDLKYLIQQAEKYLKLKKQWDADTWELAGEKALNDRLKEREKNNLKHINALTQDYYNLYKQNQRYKQALEFYADKKTYDIGSVLRTPIGRDCGETARQALEGKK